MNDNTKDTVIVIVCMITLAFLVAQLAGCERERMARETEEAIAKERAKQALAVAEKSKFDLATEALKASRGR
jgi:hypothetical protein